MLKSLHFNARASRRDHVAFYLIETFHQTWPRLPDREIAEAGFFPVDALPADTTQGTRRRHAEILEGAKPFTLLVKATLPNGRSREIDGSGETV